MAGIELNLSLSEEIVNLLATRLKRDIRQMESALRYLKAKTELLRVKTNVDLAKEVLECLSTGENFINPAQIEEILQDWSGFASFKIEKG